MRAFKVKLILNTLILLPISFSLFPAASFAHTSGSKTPPSAWFAGIGGGNSWIGLSSTTSIVNGEIVPPPFNQDAFSINNPSMGIAQVEAGYVWNIKKRAYIPAASVFIRYRHYMQAHVAGNIDQYMIPEFENYSYKMNYEAELFSLNGKVGLFRVKRLIPYLSGGVGFIINHLSDYSESPKSDVTARLSPAYKGNTDTKLALTLGLGLDFLINDTTMATLGYDHVFQGNLKSGAGQGTWSNTVLNFGNVQMDTVFVNLTVSFPTI